MSIYNEIKACLNITEVISFYGVKLKRNKACCPFHAEDTPSFSVNPKGQYYHCFGCGASGDVIKFVSEYFNIKPFEAVKKLNADFNLNLHISKPNAAEIARKKCNEAIYNAYKQWTQEKYNELCALFRVYREYLQTMPPFSDEWCRAAANIAVVEYKLDLLDSDDERAKIEWYIEVGEKEKK